MANWVEIRKIHAQYNTFYHVGGAFSVIALLALAGAIVFSDDLFGYSTNVYTEAVSAVASVIVTVLILDKRAEQREQRRRIEEMQAQLVRHAQINIRQVAVPAISEIRGRDWLTGAGGILQGKRFDDVDLSGADLESANFAGSRFHDANLQRANLFDANLANAYLVGANLCEAELSDAQLGDADLRQTNLTRARLTRTYLKNAELCDANMLGADLTYADLRGTALVNANLAEACLESANFDENTILPDGTHWNPSVEVERFCDVNHPNYWRPSPDKKGNYPCWYVSDGDPCWHTPYSA